MPEGWGGEEVERVLEGWVRNAGCSCQSWEEVKQEDMEPVNMEGSRLQGEESGPGTQ